MIDRFNQLRNGEQRERGESRSLKARRGGPAFTWERRRHWSRSDKEILPIPVKFLREIPSSASHLRTNGGAPREPPGAGGVVSEFGSQLARSRSIAGATYGGRSCRLEVSHRRSFVVLVNYFSFACVVIASYECKSETGPICRGYKVFRMPIPHIFIIYLWLMMNSSFEIIIAHCT